MSQVFLKDGDHGSHGINKIHLGNCYSGPASYAAKEAAEIVRNAREDLLFNAFADKEFGNGAIQSMARREIAKILNVDPANITLTVNTNDGLHMVADGLRLSKSSKVLLYQGEYPDVQTPASDALENFSAKTFAINTPLYIRGARDSKDRPLGFDLAEVEDLLAKNDVKLIMVSHVQFPNGFVTDLRRLGEIAKRHGVPVIADVAQSFGVMPLDPQELGISAVAGPLWKWVGGSLGTGFLYTSPEFRKTLQIARLSASGLELPPFCTDLSQGKIREDGRQFETSTLPTNDWILSGLMLKEKASLGIENIAQEVARTRAMIIDSLTTPRLKLFEPYADKHVTSILAYTLDDARAGREKEIVAKLWNRETQIAITERLGFIRIAPHHFTSDKAAIAACKALREAVDAL